LLAIQTVVTEASGTGFWNELNAAGTARLPFLGVNVTRIENDSRFKSLMFEAGVYGVTTGDGGGASAFVGARNVLGIVRATGVRTEGVNNVVGLHIGSNIANGNRNPDGIGDGLLLVGRQGTGFAAP
jgi:hypothetical protein